VIFGKGPGGQSVPHDADGHAPMWKKKSIFWDLPYLKFLDVRSAINVMPVTKNLCVNSMMNRLPSRICLTIEMLAFLFLIDAWMKEIDDAVDTHSFYIDPNTYFQSHLNIACMHCIP
jgi:hypothetical protein